MVSSVQVYVKVGLRSGFESCPWGGGRFRASPFTPLDSVSLTVTGEGDITVEE